MKDWMFLALTLVGLGLLTGGAVAAAHTIIPNAVVAEPERTVTSIDDIDPSACNWIHNINACSDEERREFLGERFVGLHTGESEERAQIVGSGAPKS